MALKTWATGDQLLATDLNTVVSAIKNGSRIETLVAGENLTAGQAVIIGNGTGTAAEILQGTENQHYELLWPERRVIQSFTTNSNTDKVYAVRVFTAYQNNPVNCICELYLADANDRPTGSILGTQTLSSVLVNDWSVFTFSSPVTVNPSTKYVVSFRSSNANGSNVNIIHYYSTSSLYSGGKSQSSTDSGSNWSDLNYDLAFDIDTYYDWVDSGKVYLTSATSNNVFANNFIGFVIGTVNAGDTCLVKVSGVSDVHSGLIAGSTYFLSNTYGAISTSAGSQSRKIGIALSATELLIKHDNV